MVACADAVEIDGIWYNLVTKGNVAEVTRNPSDVVYSGDIVIPEKIKIGGVEYSVTKIGDKAFYYSKKMKSVKIPNSVKSIGVDAFRDCSGLTSVTIPNSVTSIDGDAFRDCTGLASVTIPNSVTSIGWSAFSGCSGLTSITIPNSVTSIDSSAFSGCSGLTSVTIPNSVTSISGDAFRDCTGLVSITIPNSVTSIGSSAFSGCSGLTSVTIPSSVTSIGQYAFLKCENLTDVYCKPEQVAKSHGWTGLYTNPSAFDNSYPEYILLHVPSASIAAYRAIEPWSKFKEIVALTDEDTPVLPKCATPTISYNNNELSFSCATEGVEFISEVTVGDAKKYYDSKISLSQTYNVSVYATKDGYEASDVATKEIEISGGSNEGGNNSGPTLQGDVNGDGKVDVADHVSLSSIIMSTGTKPDGGNDIETDKITAAFTGGAYIKFNDQIQSGSKLNVQLSNHSGKAITLTGLYLIDGQTKYEGSNLLSENVEIPAGADVAYTLTIGALGITKPIVRFIYSYNGKTYQAEGEWKD